MTHTSGNQSNSEIVRPKLLQILIKSTKQNNSEIARLELQQIFIKSTWHHSGVDLVGLLNSPSGNRYILTLTDYFSKCAVEGTMKALKDIIIFGIPSVITTDQLNSPLMLELGIKHRLASCYYPQANGLNV